MIPQREQLAHDIMRLKRGQCYRIAASQLARMKYNWLQYGNPLEALKDAVIGGSTEAYTWTRDNLTDDITIQRNH